MDWKKFLAPELQTDDCFATGVTRQTLLKPKENVQFQRWFFENFLGLCPQTLILGRGYGYDGPSIVVSPLTKILATRLHTLVVSSWLHVRQVRWAFDVRYSQAISKTVFSGKRSGHKNNCMYDWDVPTEHYTSPPRPPYFYFRFRLDAPTKPARPMSMGNRRYQRTLKHSRYFTAKGAGDVFHRVHRHRRAVFVGAFGWNRKWKYGSVALGHHVSSADTAPRVSCDYRSHYVVREL